MTPRTPVCLRIAAALVSACLFSCTMNPFSGGSSTSETTNGVSARVIRPDGSPASGAAVILRRSDYLAGLSEKNSGVMRDAIDTLLDRNGRVSIRGLDTGAYVMEVRLADSTGVALRFVKTSADSGADAGTLVSACPATLSGAVLCGDAGDPAAVTVRIRGLERRMIANERGRYQFRVPTGRFVCNVAATDQRYTPLDQPSDSASPGSTVIVPSATLLSIHTGLIGFWSLDEDSGALVVDSSGSGNHGFVFGGRRSTGIRGNGLDFSEDSGYVGVGDTGRTDLDFGAGSDFTLSAWFRTAVTPVADGHSHRLLGKRMPDKTGYSLNVRAGGQASLRIQEVGANPRVGEVMTERTVVNSRWHHIAGVRRKGQLLLFLNGSAVDSLNMTSIDAANAGQFQIGGAYTMPENCFRGQIDEVRVYRRALRPEEIGRLAGVE